jgi:hypothetical protein
MAMQKFTLWMHKNIDGFDSGVTWLAQSNLAGSQCFENAVSLGSTVIEIDVPEIDTTAAAIEALEAEIQKERADSQVRVNLLLDRIGKLQCLTQEVAE